jgi:hypothetical protein
VFKPAVPAGEAQDAVSSTYRDTNYTSDPAFFDTARKQVMHNIEAQITDPKTGLPRVGAINNELSWRIPAGKALGSSVFNAQARPAISPYETIGLLAGTGLAATNHPYMAALGGLQFASRPNNLSRIAQGLWKGATPQALPVAEGLANRAAELFPSPLAGILGKVGDVAPTTGASVASNLFNAGNRLGTGNLPRLANYLRSMFGGGGDQ